MSNVVVRSIFHTAVVERSWKTQATSAVVHIVVIAAAFLISIPVAQQLETSPSEHVTLIAPMIPHWHPTIEPPRIHHIVKVVVPAPVLKPAPVIAKSIPPPVVVPRVMPKPPTPRPIQEARSEAKIEAESKPLPIPQPIKTGSSQQVLAAKAPVAAKPVLVGGFGDPRGVQSSDVPKPQTVQMARVGAFENPVGAGQSGGGGHLDSGSIRQAGFGNAGVTANSRGDSPKLVRTGNFGDSGTGATRSQTGAVRSTGFEDKIAAAPLHKDPVNAVAAFTPVEILFKPRPAYSAEARGLHLEGQVSMEVVFQASGAVKVVRIIRGLGHGLDEAAQQAALQVRFKPATRGGAPVDTNATISITFELT